MATLFSIRATTLNDARWIESFTIEHWGTNEIVVHGTRFLPHKQSGFAAFADQHPVGLVTYSIAGACCEIITLNSIRPGKGIGTALVSAVADEASRSGCSRLWLVTTNDNVEALTFYQKRGFTLAKLHLNAVAKARELKPSIPLYNSNGIPIRDEIELEMML